MSALFVRLIYVLPVIAALTTVPAASASPQAPLKIAIIGDSTVADYKAGDVLRGWGQLLPEFFTAGTQIHNFARNGRSTKTFLAEPIWRQTLADRPDILLIQFGHNDSHTPASTHPEATQADGDYSDNLRTMIAAARKIGATPILVTPMHRRMFTPDGAVTQELLPYAEAMNRVGGETKTPVIDLYTRSSELFGRLGDAGSADFTPRDRTHFSEKGARVMAYFVAEGAAEADPRLKAAEVSPLPDPTLSLKAVSQSAVKPVASGTGISLDSAIKTEVAPTP
jgi:lysophospholipase L1-like esterase